MSARASALWRAEAITGLTRKEIYSRLRLAELVTSALEDVEAIIDADVFPSRDHAVRLARRYFTLTPRPVRLRVRYLNKRAETSEVFDPREWLEPRV